jgi:hypothetical protein
LLIIIQFPIADSRKFISDNTCKLDKPPWLIPDLDKDFVSSFGVIRRRPLGGLSGWLSESHICEANRAIRFKRIQSIGNDSGELIKFKVAFKRFYFDGLAVGKFEIGIAIWGFKENGSESPPRKAISGDKIKEIIFYVLGLPVAVPDPSNRNSERFVECHLIKAGQALSNLYAHSSTLKHKDSTEQDNGRNWWVKACEPIIFITHQENYYESIENPFFGASFKLKDIEHNYFNEDGTLSHHIVPYSGTRLRMWSIGEPHTTVAMRQLRIFILRLHAERTCLRNVLQNISTNKLIVSKRSKQSQLLQEYLNETTKRIKRLYKHSYERAGTEIEGLASLLEEQVMPGELDSLLNALRIIDVEKNIFHKVEKFVTQPIIFRENIIMGDQFNVSGQAGAVGPNAHAHDMTFNQMGSQIEKSVDLTQLANELSQLRQEMMKAAKDDAEHIIAIGDVAKAEQAAKAKDSAKVAESLKSAGQWTLDIASKIAIPVAIEALKIAIGIPGV